ncbi:MAG TPA: SDR family NAD(P)-dependent oxidoreductase [Solirubrobacterales bacterium]|nr:SDR family NAD(P)-dependent oxidoreductase [Solirubrobacterales bacterium]
MPTADQPAPDWRRGQTVVVTGAAGVIGTAVARRFVEEGASVLMVDRDREGLESLAGSLGAAARPLELDVTDPAAWEPVSAAERIDALAHCAGFIPSPRPSWELDPAEFDRIVRVNLHATYLAFTAVLPAMRRARAGWIVNLASIAGKEGNPGQAPYSAAKAGIIGMTKAIAKEVAEFGITVNALTPTIIDGPSVAGFSDEYRADLLARIPLGRFGRPEEVAAMVSFVCSPSCSFTTGSCFDMSGGRATY